MTSVICIHCGEPGRWICDLCLDVAEAIRAKLQLSDDGRCVLAEVDAAQRSIDITDEERPLLNRNDVAAELAQYVAMAAMIQRVLPVDPEAERLVARVIAENMPKTTSKKILTRRK